MLPRAQISHGFYTSLNADDLCEYVVCQLGSFFPDKNKIDSNEVRRFVPEALKRIEQCFKHIRRKYYFDGAQFLFDHLNGDHYTSFLYFLGNSIWRGKGAEQLCTKLFLLNKTLHGIDMYFKVELPEIFLLIHPLGTVLGNAKYNNYFVCYQNCSIGATESGYPEIGEQVLLYSRSSVLGNCKIGSDVVFGANSMAIDLEIPDRSLYIGQYPKQRILNNGTSVVERMFCLM